MKTIKDLELKNKRVLLRVDFNVPLEGSHPPFIKVLDNFRIKASLPTIKYLREQRAKIILISHLGRPSGEKLGKYSLKPIALELKKLLKTKVKFLPDCLGKKIEKKTELMEPGEVLLLENLRFYQEETENDLEFAKELSKLGDFYINDAFSVSHRSHASIVRLAELLPKGAGLLLEKEIKVLSEVREKPKTPLVIIIGGKKSAKIESLPGFLRIANYLLLNGLLSEDFLVAKSILVERSFPGEKIMRGVQKINLTDPRLHLPKDVLFSLKDDWSYERIGGLGTIKKEEDIFDIGPETINIFSKIIKEAGTIVWAGPLGFFEEEKFEKGTREIGEKIVRNYKALKVAGGGDTILALKKFGWLDKFDHISTGGGAMLAFLSGESLPGIEALR